MARISQNTIAEAAAAAGTPSTIAAATTAGDGTAEDTKIVFDGNALDFRIGIDDGTDILEVGKGNAHGTTTHMTFDTNGVILKPLQPSFLVQKSGTQSNIATDSIVTITYDTERFDVGANFASNTFTAPVTGKYYLSGSFYIVQFDEGADYSQIYLLTSNRNYINLFNSKGFDIDGAHSLHINIVADMDASDTAYLGFYQSAGTAQADVGTNSWFSGYLLG